MKKVISNIINSFLFFVMLMPFYTYGYDEKWTLFLGEKTYDVTFQYHDETKLLINVYINGIHIDDGSDRLQNIITFTNVIVSAKEAGRDIMPLCFRKDMALPNMEGEKIMVFGKGKINIENYQKWRDCITFQMKDKDGNIVTVTVKNKRIFRLKAAKGKYHFLFEKKDDFDKGEGGASFQVNHYFDGHLRDDFYFYDFKKMMFLKYEPSEIFF